MTTVSVAVGVIAVVLVGTDLAVTVLHPSLRGPVSHSAERSAWMAVRGLGRGMGRARVLTFGGPAAMGADFAAWVLGLWLGFALVYAPFVHELAYSPAASAHPDGFFTALYLSGVSLTTLGFGDVVGGTAALRLVTVLEGASGLAVITAALAYITAVYPRVSLARTTASWVTDLEAHTEAGAVRFVLGGGPGTVARLQRDLIEIHQDLQRFPVLYYFHAAQPGESLAALMRAGALVCVYLRWGFSPGAVPFTELYGPGLQRTLERLMDDYGWEFAAGHPALPASQPMGAREARDRYERLTATVRAMAPEAALPAKAAPAEFAAFVPRVDAFLTEFGRVHGYAASLLPGSKQTAAGDLGEPGGHGQADRAG